MRERVKTAWIFGIAVLTFLGIVALTNTTSWSTSTTATVGIGLCGVLIGIGIWLYADDVHGPVDERTRAQLDLVRPIWQVAVYGFAAVGILTQPIAWAAPLLVIVSIVGYWVLRPEPGDERPVD